MWNKILRVMDKVQFYLFNLFIFSCCTTAVVGIIALFTGNSTMYRFGENLAALGCITFAVILCNGIVFWTIPSAFSKKK